jgi:predicted membrane-bound spermidine synthase
MDVKSPSKVAIVANDPVTVEVARTYQVLRKLDRRTTRKVDVFLTVEEAALWLRPPGKKRRHSGDIAT